MKPHCEFEGCAMEPAGTIGMVIARKLPSEPFEMTVCLFHGRLIAGEQSEWPTLEQVRKRLEAHC